MEKKLTKILIIIGSIVGGLIIIITVVMFTRKWLLKNPTTEKIEVLTQEETNYIDIFFKYLEKNDIIVKKTDETNYFSIIIEDIMFYISSLNKKLTLYYIPKGDKNMITLKNFSIVNNKNFKYNNTKYYIKKDNYNIKIYKVIF